MFLLLLLLDILNVLLFLVSSGVYVLHTYIRSAHAARQQMNEQVTSFAGQINLLC